MRAEQFTALKLVNRSAAGPSDGRVEPPLHPKHLSSGDRKERERERERQKEIQRDMKRERERVRGR